MRKIALTMVAMFAFATTTFANNETEVKENKIETTTETKETTETTTSDRDEEAVHCKITMNGMTVECWGCDCAKLAKTLAEAFKSDTQK